MKEHVVRLPLGYFPSVSWFYIAEKFGNVEIESNENYQKSSIRNRCQIAGPNGIQLLSIPLFKGKHQQTHIRDVKISYVEKWQIKHWRSIKTAYGSAPFYMHFSHELEPFFKKKYERLFDFNLDVLEKIIDLLSLNFTYSFSKLYELDMGVHDGRVYFEKRKEQYLKFQTPYYPQVFEDVHGFLPNLSILDVLFCCGSLPKK